MVSRDSDDVAIISTGLLTLCSPPPKPNGSPARLLYHWPFFATPAYHPPLFCVTAKRAVAQPAKAAASSSVDSDSEDDDTGAEVRIDIAEPEPEPATTAAHEQARASGEAAASEAALATLEAAATAAEAGPQCEIRPKAIARLIDWTQQSTDIDIALLGSVSARAIAFAFSASDTPVLHLLGLGQGASGEAELVSELCARADSGDVAIGTCLVRCCYRVDCWNGFPYICVIELWRACACFYTGLR